MDEVSFRAPELGPLTALLVGPEAGRWVCEEVDVSSSRTGHTDRWVLVGAEGSSAQPLSGQTHRLCAGCFISAACMQHTLRAGCQTCRCTRCCTNPDAIHGC